MGSARPGGGFSRNADIAVIPRLHVLAASPEDPSYHKSAKGMPVSNNTVSLRMADTEQANGRISFAGPLSENRLSAQV
jgi:hypothetical protein